MMNTYERNKIIWTRFFKMCNADLVYRRSGDFYLRDVPLIHNCNVDLKNFESSDFLVGITEGNNSVITDVEYYVPLYVVGKFPENYDANNLWKLQELLYDSMYNTSPFSYSFGHIDNDEYFAFPGITIDGGFALFGTDGSPPYCSYLDEVKTLYAYYFASKCRID